METMQARCCVAGGGPAGMMLAFLLARAGIDVVVLEKHADFLRDFRGDTVHPSTLDVIAELGLLDAFLARPHQELRTVGGIVDGTPVTIGDLTHLPTRCKFIAIMPQWDFLNFLADNGRGYPGFHVRMCAEVTDLIDEGGTVRGVRATTPDGPLEVRADLVVGADGRHSTVRARAGLSVQDFGAPIDVLWMRLARRADDPENAFGYFQNGHVFVTIPRGDYWQCAFVIRKGGFDALRAQGLDALQAGIAAAAPFFADRVSALQSWSDVSLLTVTIDRLRQWYRPGLLCIGDAAHAMSPMGGVGINLAIQDAVAAANILAEKLRAGTVTENDLRAVERRRTFPVRVTQGAQMFMQARVFGGVVGPPATPAPVPAKPRPLPFPLWLFTRFPVLQRLPAMFVGMGVRPEHVRTPHAAPAQA